MFDVTMTRHDFSIYIDSPMAIEATKLYGKHVELFDDDALASPFGRND